VHVCGKLVPARRLFKKLAVILQLLSVFSEAVKSTRRASVLRLMIQLPAQIELSKIGVKEIDIVFGKLTNAEKKLAKMPIAQGQ
jgi:hypothetical protein